MTQFYKGDRIKELLEDLARHERVFYEIDPEDLSNELRGKLIAAKAMIAITKAKLTSLQEN